jgi:hypothetical protein
LKGTKYNYGVQMQDKMDTTLSMHGKQEIQRKLKPERMKVSEHLCDSETGRTIVMKLILNKLGDMSGFIWLRVRTRGKLL